MKGRLSTFLLILIFLIGLSLLLYPMVSDYWNSMHQSWSIAGYTQDVAAMDEAMCAELWQEAEDYNEALRVKLDQFLIKEDELREYNDALNISGDGIMGYIEIPKIDCFLPIYHGTDVSVLQVAVGHMEGSSLPTGGPGTHCVLSGHRGLPSAKLFTNLDKMAEGDTFVISVLNETLTYQVDQILVLLPHEMDALRIVEGQDYCTLITCTPYGVNSHRLLVRGHRVENAKKAVVATVTADAVEVDQRVVAFAIAAPMILILMISWLFQGRKR